MSRGRNTQGTYLLRNFVINYVEEVINKSTRREASGEAPGLSGTRVYFGIHKYTRNGTRSSTIEILSKLYRKNFIVLC